MGFSFKTVLAGGLACVLMAGAVSAQEMTLRFGHVANEQNVWHKAAIRFGEELSRLTDGRIVIEVYPNETLGRELDLINGMDLGTAEITLAGESLQSWAPMAGLIGLPYAYPALEDVDRVIASDIGRKIEADITEKSPARPIGYFVRDARNLTSNRPIKSPDDLNGLKLRVSNVPLHVAVWRALGANPTPMAFSEVFTSLQNGTIDAQENPLALINSANFFEVQKYVNLTEHVRSWLYIVIANRVWDQFSDEDKTAVTEAAKIASQYQRELFLAEANELVSTLEGKGMAFVEVDKPAFVARAREAVLENVDAQIRPYAEELLK